MGYFLLIIGFFVLIFGLVKLLIDLIRKAPIKKSKIILTTGIVMFIIGILIVPKAESSSESSNTSSKSSQSSTASAKKTSKSSGRSSTAHSKVNDKEEQMQHLASMSYTGYDGQKFLSELEKAGVKNIDLSKITFTHDDSGASYSYPYGKSGEEYTIFVKPDGTVGPLYDPSAQKKAKEFANDNSAYVETAAKKIFEQNGYEFNGHVILGGTNGGYNATTQQYETDFLDAEVTQGSTNYKHQKVTVLFTAQNNKIDHSKVNDGIEIKKIIMNGTTIYE